MSKTSLSRLMMASCVVALVGCGGSSGSDDDPVSTTPAPTPPSPSPSPSPSPPGPTPSPSPASVEISGALTYDFVPHTSGGALDYDNTERRTIKGAVVQLLNASGIAVESTVSNEQGNYAFTVDPDTSYRIRVRAELSRSSFPSWQIRVTDNTNGNALYTMDGSLSSSGTGDSTRDLHAPSGWGGSSYTSTRVAAPFAILDSVYQVVDQLVDAGLDQNLPSTELRWSENNRAANGQLSDGNIGTSFYTPSQRVMYILGEVGSFSGDSDDYDRSVIQHEFGHYLEDVISRSDSIGGQHTLSQQLDMRVAFSEGFANALTGIVSGEAVYRDSVTSGGTLTGFDFSLERIQVSNLGWYSEASAGYIVQDIADDSSESGDDVDLGLSAVVSAMSSTAYRDGSAMTSIYSFLDAVKAQNPNQASAIDALAADHSIFGSGPLGENETNDGGVSYALPVYRTLDIGESVNVCSGGDRDAFYNWLQTRRFVNLNIPRSASYIISIEKDASAVGTGEKNPQADLFLNGQLATRSNGSLLFRSNVADQETETLSLNTGTYVLVVYDEDNVERGGATVCFDVSLAEV